VGDVPDYTLRNDIVREDRLFYEWNHFRPVAGYKILSEVLGKSDAVEPARVVAAMGSRDGNTQGAAGVTPGTMLTKQ